MEDRQWMYTGRRSRNDYDMDWVKRTDAFLNHAFGAVVARGHLLVWCPCSHCDNKRRVNKETMGKHLVYHGYTPGYYRWIYHGEDRIREEVVRPCLESFNDDAGVADMLDDTHQAQFAEGRDKEDMEANVEAFYKMLESASKPLHEHTTISQLDDIGRVIGLKAELNLSREGFDKMLTVFATMLPKDHILPPTCTSKKNSFVRSRCHMIRYIVVRKVASYFGKNTRMQSTVRSVEPQDTSRQYPVMARRCSLPSPLECYVTFLSWRGSNDFS